MEIIELTRENFSQHARQIAEIHKDAYSKKHMTAHFSQKMLEEYYRCLVEESELCVLSLKEVEVNSGGSENCEIGFIIAGSAVSKGVSNFLRSNRLYVLSVMLKNPVFLCQKIYAMLMAKFTKGKPSSAKFRLLSISVRGDSQSSGVGKTMLSFFEQALIKRNIDSYGLSVRAVNERAISFYERNGFVLEKVFMGSKYYFKSLAPK